jgi:TRAP transporter TAXI family solute receptor
MRMSTVVKGLMLGSLCLSMSLLGVASPAATARKPYRIKILGLKFGTLGYVSTFALAEVINKNSTWLRATGVETRGTIVNARTLATDKAARKHTVALMTLSVQHLASSGLKPFKKPYQGMRAIMLAYRVAGAFITLDPKIRTGRDLIGKRVGVGKKGSTSSLWPEVIFKYGWKIADKVRLVYLGYKGSYDALRSGSIHAALLNPMLPGALAPAARELVESVRRFYILSVPASVVAAARKASGMPIYPASLPPKVLSPKQTQPLHGYSFNIGFWADKDLPADVAYEICRIVWEHLARFKSYHAGLKGLTHQTMALAAGSAKDFHPGALKFYREKKVKIGLDR